MLNVECYFLNKYKRMCFVDLIMSYHVIFHSRSRVKLVFVPTLMFFFIFETFISAYIIPCKYQFELH